MSDFGPYHCARCGREEVAPPEPRMHFMCLDCWLHSEEYERWKEEENRAQPNWLKSWWEDYGVAILVLVLVLITLSWLFGR